MALFVNRSLELPPAPLQGLRRGHIRREYRGDLPELLRDEGLDTSLTLDDQPNSHRLDPPRRQPGGHLLPQQWADLVADDPVQDPPRLLGVHLVRVDLARLGERGLYGRPGDFVEDHPPQPAGGDLEGLGQVPGDGLTLAVEVGRQEDLRGGLGKLPQLGEDFRPPGQRLVGGAEVVFQVHAQALGRQVADVPHGGLDHVPGAEVAVYRPCLGGRFDHDELLARGGRGGRGPPLGRGAGSPAPPAGGGSFTRRALCRGPGHTIRLFGQHPRPGE